MRTRRREQTDRPVLVTTAPRSPRDDRLERQRRYLWTMGIRVVLFIAAIVLFAVGLPWPFWAVAAAASIVMPWVAVVVANAGPRTFEEQPSLYAGHRPDQLPPGTDDR